MNTSAPETVVTGRPAGKSAPRRTGLRREIGFIGLLWASAGSIIGSGWLFGAQKALIAAGPAAIISWGIGALAIFLLALTHAELGGMWPVAGGTARFPHYAFGGGAGASFGWFSWLQAATVAPIEVLAMITYGQHYSFASGWMKTTSGGTSVLTASGIVAAVILMAIFTSINFLGIRKLAHTNSAATWWKVGIPLLTIFVLGIVNFHASNFHAADGFNPFGAKGVLAAVSTSGIIFALLGFEQADQLAGESARPKRDIPRAVIFSVIIGAVIYIALQVVFLGALPSSQIGHSWATGAYTTMTGPFAQVATLVGVGWLAAILYVDAIISPGGTGLIYTTSSSRVSYGLSQNGYFPTVYESTDAPRRAVVRADHGIRRRLCLLPAVPELDVARRADHRGERAHVRRRAARLRRLPPPAAERGAAVARSGRLGARAARLRRREPAHPLVGLGHRLAARRRDPDRLRDPRRDARSSTGTRARRSSTSGRRAGCRSISSGWARSSTSATSGR